MVFNALRSVKEFSRPSLSLKEKLKAIQLNSYRPNVSFEMNIGHFKVKTAANASEVKQALILRKKIFLEEKFGTVESELADFENLDSIADHILLIDKRTNNVIGTYRIICDLFCNGFYSPKEFYMDDFLSQEGVKVELGRACLDKEYRKGLSISLIWTAIGKYCREVNASYLFGCASVDVTNSYIADALSKYLEEFRINKFNINVKEEFLFPDLHLIPDQLIIDKCDALVPPLLRSYLKAGARIYSSPALDLSFCCSDFLTILDLKELNPSFGKRYFS